MNNSNVQQSALARFWAVVTMFAVVLSAFSAPFSVALAEETTTDVVTEELESVEVVEEQVITESVEEVTEETTEVIEETTETESETELVEETETVLPLDEVQEVLEEQSIEEFAPTAMMAKTVYVPSCQNLFQNGSFEDPEVTDSSLWQKFASVTGWLVERVSDLSPTTLEVHRGWSGNESAEGLQYAELDGDHSTQISQIVTTVPGAEYELTWAFAPRHDISAEQNKMDVLVNGGLVGSNGPETGSAPLAAGDWTYTSANFVATTTDTTFTFRDIGTSDSFGTFLDDAQLCLVELPEPETEVITVCKVGATENPISGWGITITNDQVDNKLVSYSIETGENGCVSQEVDPLEGPFYVIEENRAGWDQVDVWAQGGLVEEGQGAEICSFFNPVEDNELSARVLDIVVPTFSCHFMNVEDETPAPVCEAQVNLIQNGSFETPDIPEDGFGWDIYDSVANGLVWVVDWLNPTDASPMPAKLELQSGYYAASHGMQYAELDSNWNPAPGGPYNGEDARVSIYQDIATIPGNTYTVSYDFSALPRRAADTNILQVLLDEIEVAEHTANGIGQTDTVWTSYSYTFVATSTESRVGFADAGLADSFGTLLDNVSVVCAPTIPEEEEPAPNRRNGGGGGKKPTPTVAGDSISAANPAPMVLGEQVTAVPYGAPGTGHGGSAQQNTLSLGSILFLAGRRTNLK